MAVLKKPYEISIWIERLGTNGSKIEEKGLIIGAHDMSYLGRATNVVLRREIKGTNTLTFDMPDRFFDSLTGEYVRNEYIDELFPERKLKLFYDGEWFEFFIKKVSEKKIFKSYMKSFSCTDAFIDELSRNGYGIIFDEELYNNVEEAGTFTEEVLEDSIWEYHPEHNWGDFSEFKEEKLYRIPLSQFGGTISGYKLWFQLTNNQREYLDIKEISNVYTGEVRNVEMSDDAARTVFWDQQNLTNPNGEKENSLKDRYVENIPNDGYIYVPYSCLNFCYGSKSPDETLKYDRAATEIALTVDDQLILAPDSVDPNTIIQFIAIPSGAKIEIDDAGVILNKDYHYFLTLREWNEIIQNNIWYFFEDTRLVSAETLGAADLMDAQISHTFRYLYQGDDQILDTYRESWGNKVVFYDGYLSDINETNIIKGRKYSITDRTEINISEEIDQYTTVYNNSPDEYKSDNENLYTSEDWDYEIGDNKYRVCSKLETRQIIPQLARNLIQNGTNIKTTDGWAPMHYLETDLENNVYSATISLRTMALTKETIDISGSTICYEPPHKSLCYEWTLINREDPFKINNTKVVEKLYSIGQNFYYAENGESINTSSPLLLFLANQFETPYSYTARQIRSNYTQTPDGSAPVVINIYPHHDDSKGDIISWRISKNSQETEEIVPISLPNYSFINFGIIGQEKKIEKDKIYCLGMSVLAEEDFSIYIGKGSLITTGNYSLSEDFIKIESDLIFKDNPDIIKTIPDSFSWDNITTTTNLLLSPSDFPSRYILFRAPKTMENPYFVIQSKKKLLINKAEFFEAYTKGYDSFEESMAPYYRYSGRDLFGTEQPENHEGESWFTKTISEKDEISFDYSWCFESEDIRKRILFEDAIMLGSTYGYQRYYIQRLRTLPPADSGEEEVCYDTCGVKVFISSDQEIIDEKLPLDEAKYSEDNYVIETNFINLNKCQYYIPSAEARVCDCCYGGQPTKTCYYQKFGYCPYRFETEKHNRRIRTLKISKSNRFNILQEISKVFEFYPQFWIEHKENGKVVRNEGGEYSKQFFYITEKGMENKVGFRYEKNLKDISREINSDQIVTKLYVEDVDSEISKTGLCSIKSAEDNPSKDSFIIDMSYYIAKGMLDEDEVTQDLYGLTPSINSSIDTTEDLPQGFLRQLGYYNTQYDNISNKIINLTDASFDELSANLIVNLEGITTAQEQLLKIKQQMERFNSLSAGITSTSQSYENYKTKYAEQQAILIQLITDTFFTNNSAATDVQLYNVDFGTTIPTSYTDPAIWFSCIKDYDKMKENWVDKHLYTEGILGQYNKEYNQIQAWKKERASYLKLINRISTAFYKKYEPYLKEGTWTDSNYLTDNAYYFGALDVAAQGAIPKVSYTISVLDLGVYEEYEDVYKVGLADTTYVEDIGMFGINKKTGLPNRLKVIVSEISYNLDDMSKVDIKVQNFTTQFEDLFQQVTASVQSLTYNENIYKRSSNFTSLQNVKTSSLQGTLDGNDLTLLNTDEQNIQLDNMGTRGSDINNHANKYKLDGQGLFFSNDGGAHWSVGVGPSGINADYIKVGTLDASKIKIVDGNYIYFSWDKDGIVSYRDPQSANVSSQNINDYALFNKYGLSIVENGQLKLRAGYSFNGTGGSMETENEPGEEVGFYLFNSTGSEIFSTVSSAEAADQETDTARLKLIGEMYVSDSLDGGQISETSTIYNYSKRITTRSGRGYQSLDNAPVTGTFPEHIPATAIKITGQVDIVPTAPSTITDPYIQEIYQYEDLNNQICYCSWPAARSIDEPFVTYYKNIDYSSGAQSYAFLYLSEASTASSSIMSASLYYTEMTGGASLVYNVGNIDPNEVYKVNNQYYNSFDGATSQTLTTGAAGIFINNKKAFSGDASEAAKDGSRRLLCITKIEGTGVKNILSVLKDGQLYIGGNINATGLTTLGDLPDSINIDNYKIRLSTDGSFELDFDMVTNVPNEYGRESLSAFVNRVSGAAASGAVDSMRGHFHYFIGKNFAPDGVTLEERIAHIEEELQSSYLPTTNATERWG